MASTPLQISQEDVKIREKTEELILMTEGKGPRRWRQRKGEYLQKLEKDNEQLKDLIVELEQQISAAQAQKDIYLDQLTYFKSCLAQAAPLVFQQQQQQQQTTQFRAISESEETDKK